MPVKVYQDDDNYWRWRITADNGEPVASGEAFVNKADAEHSMRVTQDQLNKEFPEEE
jgi:uncharacterized protein YegP (UPF0339 family)